MNTQIILPLLATILAAAPCYAENRSSLNSPNSELACLAAMDSFDAFFAYNSFFDDQDSAGIFVRRFTPENGLAPQDGVILYSKKTGQTTFYPLHLNYEDEFTKTSVYQSYPEPFQNIVFDPYALFERREGKGGEFKPMDRTSVSGSAGDYYPSPITPQILAQVFHGRVETVEASEGISVSMSEFKLAVKNKFLNRLSETEHQQKGGANEAWRKIVEKCSQFSPNLRAQATPQAGSKAVKPNADESTAASSPSSTQGAAAASANQ